MTKMCLESPRLYGPREKGKGSGRFCLPENVPSPACSRSVTQDLGLYSFMKISVIPQESLTLENENILYQYLAACADNAFW